VIIAKAGRPVARLIPIQKRKPILGSARGTIEFQPGWDDPLSDKEMEEIFGQDS
jgi:antitoxin (DNA-binding transcriptional repressor) of toxin-antitoxin stability system